MGFFDRFNLGSKEIQTEIPGVSMIGDNIYSVSALELSDLNSYYPSSIYTWYTGGKRWVPFGKNNLFPVQLADLYYSSPLHSTIIEMKSKILAGEVDLSLLPQRDVQLLNILFGRGTSMSYKVREMAIDWYIFGAFSLEIIWNANFTAISKVNRIPVMNVRLGIENARRESEMYYYSNDWRNVYNTTSQVVEIPRFDVNNKKDQAQLLYVKNPSLDGRYYGVPGYTSGLNSIAADAAISLYQLAIIENGFNPGLVIKFYKKPNSPEQKREIIDGLDRTYGGKKKAGKVMVMFSDGKELAPDVSPIDVSNLDKQFTVLESSITEKIIFSHNAVSGILYGKTTSGQLGTSNEFMNADAILDARVVSPDRILFEETLNSLLSINGIGQIKLKSIPVSLQVDQKTTPTK